jgi:hypothetical protein
MAKFFLRKYLSPSTMELGREYIRWETRKSELEEQRPKVFEQVLAIQEAELSGKSDAKVLEESKGALVDIDLKISACDRALTRVLGEIPQALTRDIDSQFKKLGRLKSELDRRQAAAARRVHLAQEVAAFFQGTDLSKLETIGGKLAELQGQVQTISKDPEALDFQDLAAMVNFMERVWAPPAENSVVLQEVKGGADWKEKAHVAAKNLSAHVAAVRGYAATHLQEHEGHLNEFGRQILSAAREELGVDPPKPKVKGKGWVAQFLQA